MVSNVINVELTRGIIEEGYNRVDVYYVLNGCIDVGNWGYSMLIE
jgi:hypothetical protein